MQNTYYIQKSANGTSQVTLSSKLFEHRVIFINEVIDAESVNNYIQQLLVLAMEDSKKPITLLINSPGGVIQDGLALVDVMDSIPCKIKTISVGLAASMGAIILAAGNERYITEKSQVMIHEPLISNGIGGSCSTILSTANSLLAKKEQINSLLQRYTGKSAEEVDKATNHDNYMSAEEALDFGIVDKILDETTLYNTILGGNEI